MLPNETDAAPPLGFGSTDELGRRHDAEFTLVGAEFVRFENYGNHDVAVFREFLREFALDFTSLHERVKNLQKRGAACDAELAVLAEMRRTRAVWAPDGSRRLPDAARVRQRPNVEVS